MNNTGMQSGVAVAADPRTIGELVSLLSEALHPSRGTFEQLHSLHEVPRDIVAALLDVPRFWPDLHRDDPVTTALFQNALHAVRLLEQGAPFGYAVGRAAFRHLTLRVDPRVLIPRPETELLIDEAYRLVEPGGVAVDVGTGSGAIALALATERPEWFSGIIAIDVSQDALAVAQENAARILGAGQGIPVEFRHGSLLAPVREMTVRLIVSNPPYIAPREMAELPPSVAGWEPHLALVSEDEGMAATRDIIRDAADLLEPGGGLLLEVDSRRARGVAELLYADGRYQSITIRNDLTGRERFVAARR